MRMRRSSSTTSRCGASSGSAGSRSVAGAGGCRSVSALNELFHLGSLVVVDDATKKLFCPGAFRRRKRRQCLADAARLQVDQAERQRAPGVGRVEQALPPVERSRLLHNEAGVDQLLQHPAEALLGDLENIEQVGDPDAWVA